MEIRCRTSHCNKLLESNVLVYIGYKFCRHCKQTRFYEIVTEKGLEKLKQL